MRFALIVGSVPMKTYLFPKDAFVIAADGGYALLKEQGITPDLTIGDFDSLGFVPTDTEVLHHPVQKDDTDTMLAVKEALHLGYRTILLYGCLGGERMEHTLANLQTLAYIAHAGGIGFMTDGETVATSICNKKLIFDADSQGYISVFCNGENAEGVTIQGMKYPLLHATLTADMPLGVSNQFVGRPSFISVKKGTLLLIWHMPLQKLLKDL